MVTSFGEHGLDVHLLSVGHGNCAVIFSGNRTVLVDCAPALGAITETLHARHVIEIDDVIITHWDKDHFGGLSSLIGRGFRINRLWFVMDPGNTNKDYVEFFAIAKALRLRGLGVIWEPVQPGRVLHLADRIRMTFLLPYMEAQAVVNPARRNGTSVVCKLGADTRGLVLFLGDVTLRGLREAEPEGDWSAQWVVASHHGGKVGRKRSDSVAFMEIVHALTKCQNVFVSHGRGRYMNPIPEFVNECTRLMGPNTVVCSEVSRHCKPVDEQEQARVRKGEVLCAGGVHLRLDETAGLVWDRVIEHAEFVSMLPSPLCRQVGVR